MKNYDLQDVIPWISKYIIEYIKGYISYDKDDNYTMKFGEEIKENKKFCTFDIYKSNDRVSHVNLGIPISYNLVLYNYLFNDFIELSKQKDITLSNHHIKEDDDGKITFSTNVSITNGSKIEIIISENNLGFKTIINDYERRHKENENKLGGINIHK